MVEVQLSRSGLDRLRGDNPQMCQRLRLYTFLLIQSVCQDWVHILLVALFWPARVWFSDLASLQDGTPWEIPVQKDLLSQMHGTIYFPKLEIWKLLGLAPEGYQLIDYGLSTEVDETVHHQNPVKSSFKIAFQQV